MRINQAEYFFFFFFLLRKMSQFLVLGTRLIAEGPAVLEAPGTEATARTGRKVRDACCRNHLHQVLLLVDL